MINKLRDNLGFALVIAGLYAATDEGRERLADGVVSALLRRNVPDDGGAEAARQPAIRVRQRAVWR